MSISPLHWRHNDHGGVSNHRPRDCLLNLLFRRRWKKTSKLRVTGLCAGNSPGSVHSLHKGPVTWKMFPFDDVIMQWERQQIKTDHGYGTHNDQSGRSPKVVALFSATNFSSYIIELLQLHDTIQIKWNYARIHYRRSPLMIWKDVQNFICATKFSSIFLLPGKHSFGKVINEVWYQACDLMRFIQQTHTYILHQTYEYHLSHAACLQMIVEKTNVFVLLWDKCY